MPNIYMKDKSKKIISMLLAASDYMTLDGIAEDLELSKRSIYYEICKINEWLESYGLSELCIVRGKGIFLDSAMKNKIEEKMSEENKTETYVFSPTERVFVIICFMIHSEKPIYVEELSEYCMVSRNTIFSDLRVVVNQLQEYDLKLEYVTESGYRIIGDGVRIRALFFLYFNMLHPLFVSGVLKFIQKEQMEKHLVTLEKIQDELHIKYVDGILLSLAVLMPMMLQNNTQLYFPNIKTEELENTKEYLLVSKYYPELSVKEKIYLCLHLLGSRVTVNTDEIFDYSANESVYEMSKALVAEFEKVACVEFEDKDDLERSLFLHISASMYRYNYGIQIGNPMKEDIVSEYPNLFEITRIVSKYLEQQIGLPIPDGEVAYLALHFGAHLHTTTTRDERLRILIVCVNGISTGNMLKSEVAKLLPDAKIVDVVAVSDAINVQNICDIVISTVKIKSLVPVIEVHPILKDFDRKNILNHPRIKGKRGILNVGDILTILRKYVPEDNFPNMEIELNDYFSQLQDYIPMSMERRPITLGNILTEENVCVTEESYKWEQLIRYCGDPLVKRKNVTPHYVEKIISQIRYYGPYMFITPSVILAHAKPEDGVNHLDVSLTVLKKEVKFSEFHQARVVIVLAAEDQEKHLHILKDIMQIFSVDTRVEELQKLDTADAVIHYIRTILNKDN